MAKFYISVCEHCGQSGVPVSSTLVGCFCHKCLDILINNLCESRDILEELAESETQECAEAYYPAASELAAAEVDPNGSKYTLMWE